jgi:hypothetical protein
MARRVGGRLSARFSVGQHRRGLGPGRPRHVRLVPGCGGVAVAIDSAIKLANVITFTLCPALPCGHKLDRQHLELRALRSRHMVVCRRNSLHSMRSRLLVHCRGRKLLNLPDNAGRLRLAWNPWPGSLRM